MIQQVDNKKKGFFNGSDNSRILMILFVMFVSLSVLILHTQYFCEHIKNEIEKLTLKMMLVILYIMSQISYIQTVRIKNKNYQITTTNRANSNLYKDPVYQNINECTKCMKAFKPRRTSHCSACGECQLKMDHHCPWTANCIGHRNHQPFLLFNFYLGLGASIYSVQSVLYFHYSFVNEQYFQIPLVFHICWGIINLIVFPFSIMTIGLFGFHFLAGAVQNVTTIENMKGIDLCDVCEETVKKGGFNVYDKGIVGNLASFFNSYLFWWPQENISAQDGTNYSTVPFISLGEHKRHVNKRYRDDYSLEDELNKIELYRDSNRDKQILLDGQTYQF